MNLAQTFHLRVRGKKWATHTRVSYPAFQSDLHLMSTAGSFLFPKLECSTPTKKVVHTQRRPTMWTREPCTSQVVCKVIGSNPSVRLQKLNLYGSTSIAEVETVKMIRIKIFPGKLVPFLPPLQQTKTFIIILEYNNLANNKMTYVFFLLGVPHWFPGLAERLGFFGLLVFCFIFFN